MPTLPVLHLDSVHPAVLYFCNRLGIVTDVFLFLLRIRGQAL